MFTLATDPLKKCLSEPPSLVFGIEVEQREWYLIGFEPLRQGDHKASLANSAFATHGETTRCSFAGRSSRILLGLTSFRARFLQSEKCLGFALCSDWLCLSAANSGGNVLGNLAGAHGRSDSSGGSFVLHLLSVFCPNLDKEWIVLTATSSDTLVKDANDIAITCSPCGRNWRSSSR